MKAIVRVEWSGSPELKLAKEGSYERISLEPGNEIEYQVVDRKRCVGFNSGKGEMEPCPEFRQIDSGDQCGKCQRKDVYSGWRRGESTPGIKENHSFSVYLLQSGDAVKVGVARRSRLETRWREQGADYASEVLEDLDAEESLEMENQISNQGVSERIRKERKIREADSRKLRQKLQDLGFDEEIESMPKRVEAGKLVRSGRFPKPLNRIKGQIVSNGRIAMALTSGKILVEPRQTGLEDYSTHSS